MDEEKFIQRVENMVYYICGCSEKEAVIILEKCLKRAKNGAVEYKERERRLSEKEQAV